MVDMAAILYPHTCTVTRISAGSLDAIGQPEKSTATVSTSQVCRYEERGTRELAGRYSVVIDQSRLFLPSGANVAESDRISAITKNGTVIEAGPLEVTGIKDARDSVSSVIHHVVATVEEVLG